MFTEKKATAESLLAFYNKVKKAWCKDSCSPSLRENWPNGNVAKGQCFVTAIAVQEAFGGEVYELHITEKEIHYYNIIAGEIVDLSSEQFGDNISAEFYRAGIPTDVALKMSDPIKRERYAVLSKRMKQEAQSKD